MSRRIWLFLIACLGLPIVALGQPAAPSNLVFAPGPTIGSDDGIHFWLGVQLIWQNNATTASYTVVETSTNNGASWFYDPASDMHSATTVSAVKKVPQGAFHLFRVFCIQGVSAPQVSSLPSNILRVWGEQAPSSVAVIVDETNRVRISLRDNCGTEDGFMVEQSTNAGFVGAITRLSAPASLTTQGTVWLTNLFSFSPGTTYYWRASATNRFGYTTEFASSIPAAAPNAAPSLPSYFTAYNTADGVSVQWNAGSGLVARWYIDVSIGDTNHFASLVNMAGGSPQYSFLDRSQTRGTICYYRCTASNAVGIAVAPIKTVYVPQNIASSVWYIDSLANGNGNGTNWANAWPSFASIAWANIQPGATIWIAPGSYNEALYVGSSGTSNAPVRFKVATTNSPRTGQVIAQAIVNQAHPYVWFDGARSDSFSTLRTESITNNCAWRLQGNPAIQRAIFTLATGVHIEWIEITGNYVNSLEFGEGSVAGIYVSGGVASGDTKIGYCWIHDMTADNRSGADGIDVNPNLAIGWGATEIHHCLIERVRDNFIGGGGAIDVHDCVLQDWTGGTPTAGHPDGIQNGAGYWRIYNNIIRDTPGACLYPEIVLTNTDNILIYNNIIYGTGRLTNELGQVYPGSGITWSTEPNTPYVIPTMTVSNVLIANNTFYGFDGGYLSATRRISQCGNLVLKNWSIVNNLVYTHSIGAQFGAGYTDDQDPATVGTNYTAADILLDWNDVCGRNNIIGWKGNYYTPSTIGLVTGATNNFTYLPQFANRAEFDFHLTAGDATNMRGRDLSGWPMAVGLDRNQDGTLRSTTGWPVGALSREQGGDLAWWLSFNNFTGANDILDGALSGNDALLYNASRSNWPGVTNGPIGQRAAWIGAYQYLVVTNWNNIERMSEGTVALWGYYTAASSGDSVFIDAGHGHPNGWWFGRDNSFFNTRLWVTDATGIQQSAAAFPDNFAGVNSDRWHHYAVSWNNGTFVAYYDGVPVQTNTLANCAFLSPSQPHHWLAIGSYTHDGTPQFDDVEGTGSFGAPGYPNNGWLMGGIADIRVYRRALSPAEVQGVYAGNPIAPRPSALGRPSPPRSVSISLTP